MRTCAGRRPAAAGRADRDAQRCRRAHLIGANYFAGRLRSSHSLTHTNLWARAVYQQARDRGCEYAHAIRILARAWCRVLWTCWLKARGVRPDQASRRPSIHLSPCRPAGRVSAARQRGACRGASEADGAGAATVTRMGRLWPARTRKRPRKASTVVRRARRPAPIRFAMPRRAPRVRVLPATTRGGTTCGTPAPSTAVAKISPMGAL